VPETLSKAGLCVEPHRKHFADDAPDTEWLPEVGRRGWIVLTKDYRIRHNPLEQQAVLLSGVKTFVLTSGEMTGPEMAVLLLKQIPKIERLARGAKGALIARVTRTEVTVVVNDERRRSRSSA
jgi:hypothetical protein